eukprot:gene11436-4603_t
MDGKECKICQTKDNLKLCSKCHSVAYCSIEHQREDWKAHKQNCKEIFKIYEKPEYQLILSSSKQQKEIISSHIKGNSLLRGERGIETILFLYSHSENKCILVEDVEFIPLKIETPLYHFKEINLQESFPTKEEKIYFEIEITSFKKMLKKVFEISILVLMNGKKILFEFTSFNLQTSYQLLQAAFDFLIQFLIIPEKSQIEILTLNKGYYDIAFGKLLINQIWKCYKLKQIQITEIKQLSIISKITTQRMRKLVAYYQKDE